MALEIYVEAGCWSCEKALVLAEEIARRFPALVVEVIDVGDVETTVPDDVFAVPTYVLNGKVISLGNPSETDLRSLVEAALSAGR